MREFLLVVLTFIIGTVIGCLWHAEFIDDNPTAIDVYRGKTTLEITYRDSVAIDSTVVYKIR